MDRSQKIIRTSIIGVVANVLLAAFKAAVGILASSVAIVMDAVNGKGGSTSLSRTYVTFLAIYPSLLHGWWLSRCHT